MVLRGGMRRDIYVDRLVVGDIVDVKFGDMIPADIRIISCSGFKVCCDQSINFDLQNLHTSVIYDPLDPLLFKVDNSSLTGESEPRPRYADSEDPDPLESKNVAFFATDAVEGTL